jgi:hypothetical protein
VVDSLQSEHVATDHALKLLQNSFPQGFPEMIINPIMENEIVCTINSMDKKNLSSFDEISNTLLLSCAQYLSKPLAYIYML